MILKIIIKEGSSWLVEIKLDLWALGLEPVEVSVAAFPGRLFREEVEAEAVVSDLIIRC